MHTQTYTHMHAQTHTHTHHEPETRKVYAERSTPNAKRSTPHADAPLVPNKDWVSSKSYTIIPEIESSTCICIGIHKHTNRNSGEGKSLQNERAGVSRLGHMRHAPQAYSEGLSRVSFFCRFEGWGGGGGALHILFCSP